MKRECIKMSENNQNGASHVVINNVVVEKNSIGLAGLIVAIVGFFLSWIPVLGWIVWLVGLALSIGGLFRNPKGTAIAGLIISFLDFILLIILVTLIAGVASAF